MYKAVRILFLGLLLFLLGREPLRAQIFSNTGQELGMVAGPLLFFSDYGSGNSFESEYGNVGMGVGLIYYINFSLIGSFQRHHRFNDHFRIRSELIYHWSTLKHHGELAAKNNSEGLKLSAMIGNTRVFEIGPHLEYHFHNIRDYTAYAFPLNPFVGIGGNFVIYSPLTYSTLGPLKDNLFYRWKPQDIFIQRKTKINWAFVFTAGTRYRVAKSGDLVMNAQWRYYPTDWLDGFNHDTPQNKNKDTIFWLNFGYIYYLNF